MDKKTVALLVSVITYPVAVHTSVILEFPLMGFGVLLAAVSVYLLKTAWVQAQDQKPIRWIVWLGVCVLIGLITVAVRWDATYTLFLPPVLISLSLLVLFGRTLLPGCEPLITVIARLEQGGELPPELVSYTRNLTWIWTGFVAAMMLEAVLLAAYASLELWSLVTNILNYVFIVTLFVGEYIYRTVRFPNYHYQPPQRQALDLARRGFKFLRTRHLVEGKNST